MKKSFAQTISAGFSAILFGTCLLFFFSSTKALAQKGCKPDYSKLDKIEKKQVDIWTEKLYETSFGGKMMKTSSINITLNIGRFDTINYVELQLLKVEESDRNAAFESSLKGAKGNEFYLGIKDSDPLKYVVFDAVNKTQRLSLSGSLATVVTLSGKINNEDLQKTKEALTGKNIEAVRIKLENGLIINQDIKEKNADKAKEKAVCFFNFLQEKGVMK